MPQKSMFDDVGPETRRPDWGISWFSSVPLGKYRDSALNYATTAFLYIPLNSMFIKSEVCLSNS
jgi:hypothetical protein